jgi:hypothetical protein
VTSPGRRREVDDILGHAAAWGAERADIVAIALVGSWARGTERPDSDVDLVVLTDDPSAYTERDDWVETLAPGAELVRTGDWQAIVERRIRLPSGLEVEVGVGRPAWAATSPVDPGTRRVVRDGMNALYDPRDLLAALRAATKA